MSDPIVSGERRDQRNRPARTPQQRIKNYRRALRQLQASHMALHGALDIAIARGMRWDSDHDATVRRIEVERDALKRTSGSRWRAGFTTGVLLGALIVALLVRHFGL